MQTTLKREITLVGMGLHSGRPARMVLRPATTGGVRFRRVDVTDRDNVIPARFDLVADTTLCTLVRNEAGVSLGTVEHIMAALAGTGAVAPIFAGYDSEQETAKIFFYDILGAEFEGVEYAVSGSGSPVIRGILHYVHTWGPKPLNAQSTEEATAQALRLLSSAAEFDSATGGVNREANLYPVVKLITKDGVTTVPDERLKALFEQQVTRHV